MQKSAWRFLHFDLKPVTKNGMKRYSHSLHPFALWLLPVCWMPAATVMSGVQLTAATVALQVGAAIALLIMSLLGEPSVWHGDLRLTIRGVLMFLVGCTAVIGYILSGDTTLSWLSALALCCALLWVGRIAAHRQSAFIQLAIWALVSVLCAGVMPALTQIESHFADEEFLVLGQIAMLWVWYALIALAYVYTPRHVIWVQRAIRLPRRLIMLIAACLIAGAGGLFAHQYQVSHYGADAPLYEGISPDQPFLCGESDANDVTYRSTQVFDAYLHTIENSPVRSTPELGVLALGTLDVQWASLFRAQLLDEARNGEYTTPANSIKYGQYLAALRVYFYTQVKAAFPELFTPSDDAMVRDWFAEINRAVFRLDWVDFLYAIAFAQAPEGPYANQMIGAGLIVLLQAYRYAPQDLVVRNEQYLNRMASAQPERFRNPDDTYNYQAIWLQNLAFMASARELPADPRMRKAFEWLLALASPDGTAPAFNHPDSINLAAVSLLAANLTDDARFVWLAGRSLDGKASGIISAIGGLSSPVDVLGTSPRIGSCLLYADAGIPAQAGAFAPDKVVMRDGWSDSSTYLLMNLRFAGWHRYKATNTLTLLYQNGVLFDDDVSAGALSGLPAGRSMLRDKRIPRENLNGLLVSRTGMSAVLHLLLGEGVRWAQDPPYYAKVNRFELHNDYDVSETMIEDWRGWAHTRTVVMHHHGPIIVHDKATGEANQQAAIVWNAAQPLRNANGSYVLRDGAEAVEMHVFALPTGQRIDIEPLQLTAAQRSRLVIDAHEGSLDVVTVLLSQQWLGAHITIDQRDNEIVLVIQNADQQLTYIVPRSDP